MLNEISININDLPRELTLDLQDVPATEYDSILESLKGQILYNSRYLDDTIAQGADIQDIVIQKLSQAGSDLKVRIDCLKKTA